MSMSKSIPNRLSVSFSGSGGSGAVTAGNVLLFAMGYAGFYGVMARSAGPQIRGGESAVMLHFADVEIEVMADRFDYHFSLDWRHFERFSDEIPLDAASQVFFDATREKCPGLVEISGAKIVPILVSQALKGIKGARPNLFAVGVLAGKIGLKVEFLAQAVETLLGKKGEEVVALSLQVMALGFDWGASVSEGCLAGWKVSSTPKWHLTGNQAVGLGVLRGGLKFAAAYPITPATDIVEYLAPKLEKVGGSLLIAEDELAAINMVIGGSFGGRPAMTATSGPGFSLMTEGMGLAIASEVPVLVVNVNRGGPSTGIPTKSEQTDLNQVLYGFHGEAPHVVVAPLGVRDAVSTSQWALGLAEALQTLVVEISDQRLAQSTLILDPVEEVSFNLQRKGVSLAQLQSADYQRYAVDKTGVSPMAIPGQAGGEYVADGLEHAISGQPSSMAKDHLLQLQKRSDKVLKFEYGERALAVEQAVVNECSDEKVSKKNMTVLLTWGSSFTLCQQVAKMLNDKGIVTDLVGVRLLMPLDKVALAKRLRGRRVVVVEQSFSAQFFHYLLAEQVLPKTAESFARPGPLMIKACELVQFVEESV